MDPVAHLKHLNQAAIPEPAPDTIPAEHRDEDHNESGDDSDPKGDCNEDQDEDYGEDEDEDEDFDFFALSYAEISALINQTPECIPKRIAPLVESPEGVERLTYLVATFPHSNDEFFKALNHEQLIRLAFTIQALLMAEPDRMGHRFGKDLAILFGPFMEPLFDAIQFYIHPDNAEALAQLQASLPTSSPPLPQLNVPPAALPELFPQVDTTQFAPQFDWFIYLLTQYSPTDGRKASSNIKTLLDEIADPTSLVSLKPGFSLDKVLLHNHLINSYEEYLHYKLPQTTSCTTSPQLFPYFPTQHPLFPTPSSKEAFSSLLSKRTTTMEFITYFVYMFILGPSIHTRRGLVSFVPLLYFGCQTLVPLYRQLFIYHYRTWYSATTLSVTHQHQPTSVTNTTSVSTSPSPYTTADTTNLNNSNISDAPTQQQPDFALTSNPFAFLQLTWIAFFQRNTNFLSHTSHSRHQNPAEQFKTALQDFGCTPTYPFYRLLLYIISHCFPDPTTRDEALNEAIRHLALHAYEFNPPQIQLSSTLYRHGYTTLHQHLHQLLHIQLHNQLDDNQGRSEDVLCALITEPFNHPKKGCVLDHIMLCVHAGFLAPFPPLADTDTDLNSDLYQEVEDEDEDEDGEEGEDEDEDKLTKRRLLTERRQRAERSAILHHNLLNLRTLLYTSLVRFTGFISYFPQSTQLLVAAANTSAIMIDYKLREQDSFSTHPDTHIPFLPPHSIADPRDSTPNLQSALVEDDGKLVAVKYRGEGDDEPTTEEKEISDDPTDVDEDPPWAGFFCNNSTDQAWWTSCYPRQGAPRHQHVLHGAALDDFRVCFDWNEYTLRSHPDRVQEQDCKPYSRRPFISDEDVAWIESEENIKLLQTPETRALQQNLTKYYRQVHEIETAMVVATMQKVLMKADRMGFFDASSTSSTTLSSAALLSQQQQPEPQPTLPLRPQRTAYPFPNPTPSISFTLDWKNYACNDDTFTKQRGALYRDEDEDVNIFYDHNYSSISLSKGFPFSSATAPQQQQEQQQQQETTDTAFDEEGLVIAQGTFSMHEHIRQRSEWALELLIAGSLGLHVAPSPSKPSTESVSTATHTLQPDLDSSTLPTTPHIQHCKDQAFSTLPTLLNALQPVPLPPKPASLLTKHKFYRDIMIQVTLLATLPLYDTLLALPESSPTPGPPQ